jgi:hypothetical protein
VGRGIVRRYGPGGIVRVTCGERGRNVGHFGRSVREKLQERQLRALITLGGKRTKLHFALVCQNKSGIFKDTKREAHEPEFKEKLRHYGGLAF